MTFKYYKTDGTEVVVTNFYVQESLVIAKRCDEAFAKGSCQIIMQEPNNIPPFTVAEIDNDKYLIKSECTLYQPMCTPTTKYYVHDLEVTELSGFLEGLIVGTKVLSSEINDKAKIEILNELMSAKHGLTIVLTGALPVVFNEYRFGNGTTLWDALCQIMMRVNCRPVVTDITYSNDYKTITVDHITLNPNSSTFTVDPDRLVQWTKTQDTDNYCEYLETEANNVIDTTNLAYDRNITERSLNDTLLTETPNGTGKIYTTAKINRVNKLEVCTHITPMMVPMFGADFFTKQGALSGNTYYYPSEMLSAMTKTLAEWCIYSAPTGAEYDECQLYDMFREFCELEDIDLNKLLTTNFELNVRGTDTFVKNGVTYTDYTFFLTCQSNIQARSIDITPQCLEKKQYDAEADCQKPKYCYYTQGSNVIDGLHLEIDTALWNQIAAFFTGNFRGPLMPNYIADNYMPSALSEEYSEAGNNTGATVKIQGTLTMYNSPYMYNVEYEALTNPSMLNVKSTTPVNESAYKHIARSYGVSASQIDYDKLVSSMAMSNDMLGQVEHTIEIMLPSEPTSLDRYPVLTDHIKYGNEYLGYLLNYEIKYNVSYKSMVMYITSSVQNIANAIGIPYQYHATRNAVDGIVERPIRTELALSPAQYQNVLDNANKLILYFSFYKKNGNSTTLITDIISRTCLMSSGTKTILYCEALDQYAFGYKRRTDGTKTINEPVPYADNNNEIYSMSFRVGYFLPSLETSRNMPNPVGVNKYVDFLIDGGDQRVIYKDQYEKLTFTIEIKEVTQ